MYEDEGLPDVDAVYMAVCIVIHRVLCDPKLCRSTSHVVDFNIILELTSEISFNCSVSNGVVCIFLFFDIIALELFDDNNCFF